MRLLHYLENYLVVFLGMICGFLSFGHACFSAEVKLSAFSGAQTLWTGGDSRPDPAPIIGNISKQVYRLVVRTGDAIKGGTGFLVSGNSIIATNNHVVDKGSGYALGYVNEQGQIRWVKLHLLAVFPQKDLALLQAVENLPGDALPLAADYPEPASDLYAIGFPAAADAGGGIGSSQAIDQNFVLPSVLRGAISRVMTGPWLTNQIQHQTPISPGYSGGPLVDNRGMVVGVNSAINKEVNGISYGVAAPDLARFLAACSLAPRTVHLPRYTATRDVPPPVDITAKDEHLKRGYQMLQHGDIAGARSIFQYSIRMKRSAEAYQALAKTYDPAVLQSLHVMGSFADAAKARELYEMAEQNAGGPGRSAVMASAGCNNSFCMLVEGDDGAPVVNCLRVN